MLRFRTLLHLFQAPDSCICKILSEHSLAGARRIHQNLVKRLFKLLRQALRHRIRHIGIRNPENFKIFKQRLCPRCTDIIRNQKSLTAQLCAECCRLTARCCAQIQHTLPRNNRQYCGRRHRARLLQIVKSGVIKRMTRRIVLSLIIKSIRDPRDRCQMKRSQLLKFLHADLCRVHPESKFPRLLIAFQKCFVFRSEHFFHSFQKFFRKFHSLILILSFSHHAQRLATARFSFIFLPV